MGRQYYGISNSINGVSYQIELHSSGVALDDELIIANPVFEWLGQGKEGYNAQMIPSKCSCVFTMEDENDYGNFVDIISQPEEEWTMKVLKDGVMFWVGRVVGDQLFYIREARNTGFAQITVTAVCGLNLLDGYKMSNINFSIGDRQTMASIVAQILKLIGTYTFWTVNTNFIQDGILTENATTAAGAGTMDGSLRSIAFMKNFDSVRPSDTIDWISCKDGLEAILKSWGSQILQSNGLWVIRQIPAHDDDAYLVNYYDYDGGNVSYDQTFTHRHVVDSTSQRPKFLAHPEQYAQVPVRAIEAQFDRRNAAYTQKTTMNTTAVSVDKTLAVATGASPGQAFKVEFSYRFKYLNSVIKRYVLRYKIFVRNPSSGDIYQYANGQWFFITTGTTVSAFNKMNIDVPQLYRSFSAYYEGYQEFQFPEPPSGCTTLHGEFYIEEETATIIRTGAPPSGTKVVWTTPAVASHQFTGNIFIRQSYTSAEPLQFEQRVNYISDLDAPRDNNSKREEIKVMFYNGKSDDYGSYLAWNGSNYVTAGNWSAPWTALTGDLPELLANQWTGVYADYLPVIKGTLVDNGVYRADMTLFFDSEVWLLNGATFDAYDDTWAGEWIGVQTIYTNVNNQGEGERVLLDDDVITDKFQNLYDEISKLRETLHEPGNMIQEDIINRGTGAPTSDPGMDKTYNLQLGYDYDASAPTLNWIIQEKQEIVKSADETAQSDATLSNDSELTFTMEASKKYYIELMVQYSTSAVPQFKYGLTGPSTPGLVQITRRHGNATVTDGFDTSYTASTAITGMNNGFVEMKIVIQTGATGGTFAFQWAQNTSDVGATKVLGGSYLKYIKQ